MPRETRGAAPEAPRTDALDLDDGLSYPELLRKAGAFRDPRRGIVHKLPTGTPFRQGGRWVQQTATYPVAMSAEEAREKTRATGDRWDYYEPGVACDRCAKVSVGGAAVVSGWVLGGRKFQQEHAHVTNFDPAVYGLEEVSAPEDADDAAGPPADVAPAEA